MFGYSVLGRGRGKTEWIKEGESGGVRAQEPVCARLVHGDELGDT